MAHYFVFQDSLRFPFRSARELKMVVQSGGEHRQSSQSPKLLFILDGGCRVRMVDGFEAELRAGDLFIVPVACHHFYSMPEGAADGELHVFGLFLEPGALASSRRAPCDAEMHKLLKSVMPAVRHHPGQVTPLMQALIHQLREEYNSRLPGFLNRQDAIARELLIEVVRRLTGVATLERPALQPARRAEAAQAYIANEVREYLGKTLHRRHTLGEIAWRFQLSEEHLARLFKKETGASVMQYLRQIRVDVARKMLLNTNHTVAVLATMLGFSSSNHFCRVFTEATGRTPSGYRREYAGVYDPRQKR